MQSSNKLDSTSNVYGIEYRIIYICFRRSIRQFLGIMLVIILVPFGFSTAIDDISRDLALVILAPFYRLFNTGLHPDAPITVVLIDKQTLNLLGSEHSLDDNNLSQLLTKIACNGPSTMYLDTVPNRPWLNDRSANGSLMALMAAGKAASMHSGWQYRSRVQMVSVPGDTCESQMPPLYVAGILPLSNAPSQWSEFHDLVDEFSLNESRVQAAARRLPIGLNNDAYVYPTRLSAPVTLQADSWATLPYTMLPTPALQLYLDVQRAQGYRTVGNISAIPDNLAIAWGWKNRELPAWLDSLQERSPYPPPTTVREWACRYVQSDGAPYPQSLILRAEYAIEIAISQFIFAAVSPFREWCGKPIGSPAQEFIYTRIIPAWQVLARPSAVPKEAVEGAIRDRAVLIGYSVSAADFVKTPVHGNVPGVIIHAQALDNLLNWHQDVWRPMPILKSGPSWFDLSWALGLLYLFVQSFLTAFLPAQFRMSHFATWALLASLTVTLTVLSTVVLCLAPVNWVGYLITQTWFPAEKRLVDGKSAI
ncbi:MAG: CHASE2 domain-containing protein [Geminicoccaceae bacterium]